MTERKGPAAAPVTWLNYHHLYYFRAIALEGSVAKAAKRLRLGQPTLSTQLRLLESALERPLFDRVKKRLVLTEAGQLALGYANEIFRLGDELVESLRGRPKPGRMTLALGAHDTVPKHVVTELVAAALATESCTVSVHEGKAEMLMRDLRDLRLDLVIADFPPGVAEGSALKARVAARMEVAICGARRFAKLRQDFPRSLRGQPFVMPTSDVRLRHDLEQALAAQGLEVQMVAEAQDSGLLRALAVAGRGLVPLALPTHGSESEAESMAGLVEIGRLKGVTAEVWLVEAVRRVPHPIAAQLFKRFKL